MSQEETQLCKPVHSTPIYVSCTELVCIDVRLHSCLLESHSGKLERTSEDEQLELME